MTKEQVIKHKEVIAWWLENPDRGVWYYGSDGDDKWHIRYEPHFLEEHKYVQNDEYSDLRKAQADGKTVESRFEYGTKSKLDCWSVHLDIFKGGAGCYRIKLEEPTFKVGDWIQHPDDYVFMFQQEHIEDQPFCGDFELWKPTEGEWCVFWDDEATEPSEKLFKVAKFGCTKRGYHYSVNGIMSENIAPLEFIQTLKDN